MVSKLSRQEESAVEAFLESHLFDGGRKVHSYMLTAQRPNWAPSSEWVGFENDIKLSEGEKVVEFAKFTVNSSVVCWLAVWVKSIDRTYGDRQNYEGIGIWLRDVVITSPAPLVESLVRIGSLFAQNDDNEIAEKSLIFLQDGYPSRYARHCDRLPEELSGWRPATAPGSAKRIYQVTLNQSEALMLVSDLILSAQFLKKPGEDHSRCFIRLGSSEKSSQDDRATAELLTSANFAASVASQLPHAFSSINRDLDALRQSAKLDKNQIASLQEEISTQREVYRKTQLQLETAQERAASFEQTLSKDGEQQRFIKLFDAIAGVKSRIAEQSGMEARLSSEILRSMRLEMAPIAELSRRIDSFQVVNHQPRELSSTAPGRVYPSAPLWMKNVTSYIIWIVLLIFVTSLIFYLLT